MKRGRSTFIKFASFAVVMTVLTAFLFMTFSEYRGGSYSGYSAVFGDASRLEAGDSVRVAGVRVGTVKSVSLQRDKSVLVDFETDRSVALTTSTKVAVRYLNLVGDRYLELIDSPGSTKLLPSGSQIPKDRTASALDLDLLLGGLRPVIQGLNPQDVNALTSSLIQIFQGQGDTLDSLLSKTSSFSNTLANNDQVIQQLIDNLNSVVGTLAKDGKKFDGTVDRLEQLISGLSQDRDPLGTAVTQLDNGTASLASLLTEARPPLKGTVDQMNRLAPLLDDHQIVLDRGLQKAPDNYRKLARLGSYGSWIMYYICGLAIRVTDLQGRTAHFPMIKQEGGEVLGALMLKYRESNLIKAGFIGVVLMMLIIAVGLQPERLQQWASSVRHQALFTEAGGIAAGNDVTLSGIKIGAVTNVSLQNGDALVTFTTEGKYPLGSLTTAHIRTGSLLGERVLTLESDGAGTLRTTDVIPTSRTSSPYSLTDAVSDLTTNSAGTDTASLNQSLDTLSATIDQVAPKLGPTFDGLSRLSKSINGRNESLASLLKSASDVTVVLSQRSDQLNTLILNANDLLGVLNDRRQAIVDLLANTAAVSQQLSGLVADNEAQLAPTLKRLNSVTAMLERNRDNLTKALPNLNKFQLSQAETLANGAYYNAYVPNLQPAQLLQPFFDYAFGFRRGTNAGQPPDNAGPRAELPLPYNGIPGGSR